MHATVRIGDSMLMFADPFPEFGGPPIAEGHWPIVLRPCVPDPDDTFEKTVVEEVTPEEMQQRQAKAFGGGGAA